MKPTLQEQIEFLHNAKRSIPADRTYYIDAILSTLRLVKDFVEGASSIVDSTPTRWRRMVREDK